MGLNRRATSNGQREIGAPDRRPTRADAFPPLVGRRTEGPAPAGLAVIGSWVLVCAATIGLSLVTTSSAQGSTATVPGQLTHAFPLGNKPVCCRSVRTTSGASAAAKERSTTAKAGGSPSSRRSAATGASPPGGAGVPAAAWIVIAATGLALLAGAAVLYRDRRRPPGPAAEETQDAFDLAVDLHRNGRRHEAVSAYEDAAQNGDQDAAFNLGVLHYEAGEYDLAEAAWRRCVEHDHPLAATNLGFLLQRRGDRDGARELYRNAAGWGDETGARMLAKLASSIPGPRSTDAEPGFAGPDSSQQTPRAASRPGAQS